MLLNFCFLFTFYYRTKGRVVFPRNGGQRASAGNRALGHPGPGRRLGRQQSGAARQHRQVRR